MTDEEFGEFLGSAVEELDLKQDELIQSHNLGAYARFWFDQEQASLDFSDTAGVTHLRAAVVPIGSWSGRSGTWRWAWSNETILAPLRQQGLCLRELAVETGLRVFEDAVLAADEQMAWELTAVAVRHLGAMGAYRAPGDPSHLYLAIMSVRRVGREGWVS